MAESSICPPSIFNFASASLRAASSFFNLFFSACFAL